MAFYIFHSLELKTDIGTFYCFVKRDYLHFQAQWLRWGQHRCVWWNDKMIKVLWNSLAQGKEALGQRLRRTAGDTRGRHGRVCTVVLADLPGGKTRSPQSQSKSKSARDLHIQSGGKQKQRLDKPTGSENKLAKVQFQNAVEYCNNKYGTHLSRAAETEKLRDRWKPSCQAEAQEMADRKWALKQKGWKGNEQNMEKKGKGYSPPPQFLSWANLAVFEWTSLEH